MADKQLFYEEAAKGEQNPGIRWLVEGTTQLATEIWLEPCLEHMGLTEIEPRILSIPIDDRGVYPGAVSALRSFLVGVNLTF